MHIRISLGIKFQFEQTILNFGTKFGLKIQNYFPKIQNCLFKVKFDNDISC